MGNPKAQTVRQMSDQELAKALEEAHRELFNLRFQLVTRQLVNHRRIRQAKRHIARLKTIQRQRALASVRPEERHGTA